MREGFSIDGVHTYMRFGLRLLSRKTGSPPRDEYLERVPYSSVTHDLSMLYGSSTYGERKLSYKLEFICMDRFRAESRITDILSFMSWTGQKKLYDDLFPAHYFLVRQPEIDITEDHGAYTLNFEFRAAPEMIPRSSGYTPETDYVFPDVNEDGIVDSRDASEILSAYAKIQTGQPTGLTESQLDAADANRDGVIDSRDASLVMEFYAKTSLTPPRYTNDLEGWTEFMNDQQ